MRRIRGDTRSAVGNSGRVGKCAGRIEKSAKDRKEQSSMKVPAAHLEPIFMAAYSELKPRTPLPTVAIEYFHSPV
jgi:hypothetical protein